MFENAAKKTPEKNITSTGGANNFVAPASSLPVDTIDKKKRRLLIVGTFVVLIIVAAIFWFLFNSFRSGGINNDPVDNADATTTEPARLDGSHLEDVEGLDANNDGIKDETDVEYLSFADFYESPAQISGEPSFASYDVPLNVKVDVANYYEFSRKVNLEKGIANLNAQGFAVMENPFPKEASDFYAIAKLLDEKQIPLYLSADFISYYYQNALKASFKEVEEGVFYDSLWNISKSLYDNARARYEAHLSQVGTKNDRILEGERLETAFFAVSLELLKPRVDQIDTENNYTPGRFNKQEQQRFSFTIPNYLRIDVLKELELIRAANEQKKSPVLLYDRDYKDFAIPAEYNDNARLNNFYLAAAWLNSVFPLNYRDEACADCLLDHDDWRINFTAASLIAQDFAKNQELKDEWARVYKTMSFFKGLRDTWDYVDYRDSSKELFGDDYDVTVLFAEDNADGEENMQRLRRGLATKTAVPIQGGISLQTMDGYKQAGLQFLADFYWPNSFIFNSLSYPDVGAFQPAKLGANNVTACTFDKKYQRCQGSSQDILALIYPAWKGQAYIENSSYTNYQEALAGLRTQAQEAMKGHYNNYWSSLYIWEDYLSRNDNELPPYLQTSAWKNKMAASALGAWVDMQLPSDKLIINKQEDNNGLAVATNVPDFAMVEPSLAFFDRLLAHNKMVLGMFDALGLHESSNLAMNRLRDAGWQLNSLRAIAEKQAKGEALNADDTQYIRDFARMQTLSKAGSKTISWNDGFLGATLREKLNPPSLIIVAHKAGDQIVFAAGPIFDHIESK